MNYIHQLQNSIRERDDNILTRMERIQEFERHLLLPKFDKVQADGERGDWISVDDVRRWLAYCNDTGRDFV
jgi:hypothetical protein